MQVRIKQSFLFLMICVVIFFLESFDIEKYGDPKKQNAEIQWLTSVQYEHAVLVNINCSISCKNKITCDDRAMDSLGNFSPTVELPVHQLSHKETDSIIKVITSSHFYKTKFIEEGVGCYKPTIAIILTDVAKRPVASVCISSVCLQLEVISKSGKVQHLNFYEHGRAAIEKLCTRYQLNCCKDN